MLAMEYMLSHKGQFIPSIFVDAIRLFPPSFQAHAACSKSVTIQITRAFVPVSHVPPALRPGVTGFSPSLLLCVSQAVFPCAANSSRTIRS